MSAPSVPGDELAEVLAEVRRLAAYSRRRATGAVAGGFRSAFKGTGLEFESVREYTQGDDPRRVDWNVTARMGRPFVKTFTDERDRLVLLAIDVDRGMDGGLGATSSRRVAASVVAMLALGAAEHGDRVGAVHHGAGLVHHRPVGRGSAHALCIVRDTLLLRPATSAVSGAAAPARQGGEARRAVELLARGARRHGILFVVTDGLRGVEPQALARAARRHEVVVVRIVPIELQPGGLRADVRLVDPATGVCRVVRGRTRAARASVERRAEEFARAFASTCAAAGADLVEVPVPFERDPHRLLAPLLELFRRREARGGRG
jgi:uncharacterized protein (DUF58 family)